MRRKKKPGMTRLLARQSKEKRDRRPESAQVTGCVMRREGAPIGVGCGIPLQAKRCACASIQLKMSGEKRGAGGVARDARNG